MGAVKRERGVEPPSLSGGGEREESGKKKRKNERTPRNTTCRKNFSLIVASAPLFRFTLSFFNSHHGYVLEADQLPLREGAGEWSSSAVQGQRRPLMSVVDRSRRRRRDHSSPQRRAFIAGAVAVFSPSPLAYESCLRSRRVAIDACSSKSTPLPRRSAPLSLEAAASIGGGIVDQRLPLSLFSLFTLTPPLLFLVNQPLHNTAIVKARDLRNQGKAELEGQVRRRVLLLFLLLRRNRQRRRRQARERGHFFVELWRASISRLEQQRCAVLSSSSPREEGRNRNRSRSPPSEERGSERIDCSSLFDPELKEKNFKKNFKKKTLSSSRTSSRSSPPSASPRSPAAPPTSSPRSSRSARASPASSPSSRRSAAPRSGRSCRARSTSRSTSARRRPGRSASA